MNLRLLRHARLVARPRVVVPLTRSLSHMPRLQSPKSDIDPTTEFGYQIIPSAEKEVRVADMFRRVSSMYDVMNDIMSLGFHRRWKNHFVRSLNPGTRSGSAKSALNILDVAGGTGDVAFRLLDHATDVNGDLHTKVTVADINTYMLTEGKKRSLKTPYANTGRLDFQVLNAESMPSIPSNSVDLYTVSLGIRNFTDKQAALHEAFRVLKPGGTFACLELSHVDSPWAKWLYKRWRFNVIPLVGLLISGNRDCYQYLAESIERHPNQEQFKKLVEDSGFVTEGRGYEKLNMGIATIHKGIKPASSP